MWFKIIRILCISVLVTLGGSAVRAQDFRVVTDTKDLNTEQLIGRSLTIFHAGEAYDRVDGVSEVTIFQPGRKQFVIFSDQRMLATTISFDTINAIQRQIDRQNQDYITQLQLKNSPRAQQLAGAIAFQMNPQFNQRFDEKKSALTMASDYYTYTVGAHGGEPEAVVRDYLTYADWIKRLNTLLDARAISPAPRLMVNQALRSRNALPLVVQLKQHGERGFHYQSRHTFQWKLQTSDRESIVAWKRLLSDEKMQWVDFLTFQEAVRGGN